MSSKIKLNRGVKANLPTLDVGEPAFTTDTNELYIGSASGNILIGETKSGKLKTTSVIKCTYNTSLVMTKYKEIYGGTPSYAIENTDKTKLNIGVNPELQYKIIYLDNTLTHGFDLELFSEAESLGKLVMKDSDVAVETTLISIDQFALIPYGISTIKVHMSKANVTEASVYMIVEEYYK